jgi:LuxR family maltose regulon positive regulatory protein
VRVHIAQGAAREVLPLLARLRDAAEAAGRALAVVELLVLEAVAYYRCGDLTRARSKLGRVLARAKPEGYVRTFVDEGKTMCALLTDYVGRAGASPLPDGAPTEMLAYADRLLAAFRAETANAPSRAAAVPATSGFPLQALNARELEVLLLIAAGRSNREIAAQLVVALSTVKWHINNLFGKLDVRSRTQALARARELGLL